MSAQSPVIWVHGDDLSPENAALAAYPGAPAIFVFDEQALDRYQVTLKRIVFIYECLLEMPVVVRRGDPVAEVLAFARDHGADRIVTTPSPAPGFARTVEALDSDLPVELIEGVQFVPNGRYDLARFSRYWRDAERMALEPSDRDA